jgi:hypothetical protein
VFCHHPTSWSEPYSRLSAIVALGNLLAHALDHEAPAQTPPEAEPAMKLLGLGHDQLSALAAQAQEEMADLNCLFAATHS